MSIIRQSKCQCHGVVFVLYFALIQHVTKVAGVKIYLRQTWNFRSHAVSACIGMWHHRPMDARTACIAPWHHRLMHAVTAWALLFWFRLRYIFTPATLHVASLCFQWPLTQLLQANGQSIFLRCLWWNSRLDDVIDAQFLKVHVHFFFFGQVVIIGCLRHVKIFSVSFKNSLASLPVTLFYNTG